MFIFQGSIIANFLSRDGQQFKIPVYQRNYEWSWEQCDKLFEDIVQAANRNQLHFCGSIVFQPLAPVRGLGSNIVIDGQQRLTTIYILLTPVLVEEMKDIIEQICLQLNSLCFKEVDERVSELTEGQLNIIQRNSLLGAKALIRIVPFI